MILVGLLLVIGLVCAIAAWFVIREAARLSVEPPPPVYDVEEALDWVIENLPDDVAATLTPADARRILDYQLEFYERSGLVQSDRPEAGLDFLVGGPEMVEFICMRAEATGEAYDPVQVEGVLATQLEYLRAIGAVGPPAGGNGSETGTDTSA